MLAIIHEGPGYVAVNKPAGIATERHFKYDTVEARALVQYKRENAKKDPYIGIVHRLDRPTSGVLLLARNKSTLVKLNHAFAERLTKKIYFAVTDKPLPATEGSLHAYLVREPTRKKAFVSAHPVPGGRESKLTYRLLEEENGLYQYEVTPLTGRFHQIRAQLAHAAAPIVGDHQYGSMRPLLENCIALHARSLSFPDPAAEGELLTLTAPFPEYWPFAQPAVSNQEPKPQEQHGRSDQV